MKKQKVKNISYLCKAEFALENAEQKELVILPANAEVTSLNLQITKAHAGGAVSIGIDKETNIFLNAVATTKAGFNQSSILHSTKDICSVSAKITGCDVPTADAKGILRVTYFLPSEIMVEY